MNRMLGGIAVAVSLALGMLALLRWHAGSGRSGPDPAPAPARDAPVDAARAAADFAGEWHSPDYRYAFRIEGVVGIATISNSPNYRAGEPMLRFQPTSATTFRGTQIFTDGQWYEVVGQLLDDGTMRMEGGGFVWDMVRR